MNGTNDPKQSIGKRADLNKDKPNRFITVESTDINTEFFFAVTLGRDCKETPRESGEGKDSINGRAGSDESEPITAVTSHKVTFLLSQI